MTVLDILYVDDDDDIRTIVRMSLALDPGIRATMVASGEEALAVLAQRPLPDVVVLDVMMPGMDGPRVLDAIRSAPDTADMPVLFMTAKGRQADIDSYRARGANGVIVKPFDPLHLAADIRALLATERH